MLQNLKPVLIVSRREIRDQFRDWRIIFPIIGLTLLFPVLMNFTARQAVRFVENYGAPEIGDRLIPFLLMIVGFFPITVSLVIALDSFVGEKERKSIEPLLASPLEDRQLYLGKLLAALVPPLLAAYLGISVYLIGVYWQVGWAPTPILLTQIISLTTVQALVMVSAAVVISTQTTSVRAANLLSSFIIIPMVFLIQGESIIMFWARYPILWWVIAGLLVVSVLLVRTGVVHFRREELLGRELDSINIKRFATVFIRTFIGGKQHFLDWYQDVFAYVRRELPLPMFIVGLLLIVGLYIGSIIAELFPLPSDIIEWGSLGQGFVEGLDVIRLFSVVGASQVWLHNLRALFIGMLLGIFTFGVLGMLVMMLPMILLGYFMANFAAAGLSPFTFALAFIIPHGILEIPALIIAGAAILRLGAILASPAYDQTISEAFSKGLGNWARVVVALVIPLFLGAAFLEVYLTPRVAVLLLGG